MLAASKATQCFSFPTAFSFLPGGKKFCAHWSRGEEPAHPGSRKSDRGLLRVETTTKNGLRRARTTVERHKKGRNGTAFAR